MIDSQIISTTYGSVSRMVQNLSDNNPPLIARYITKFQLGVPEVVEIINYEFWFGRQQLPTIGGVDSSKRCLVEFQAPKKPFKVWRNIIILIGCDGINVQINKRFVTGKSQSWWSQPLALANILVISFSLRDFNKLVLLWLRSRKMFSSLVPTFPALHHLGITNP